MAVWTSPTNYVVNETSHSGSQDIISYTVGQMATNNTSFTYTNMYNILRKLASDGTTDTAPTDWPDSFADVNQDNNVTSADTLIWLKYIQDISGPTSAQIAIMDDCIDIIYDAWINNGVGYFGDDVDQPLFHRIDGTTWVWTPFNITSGTIKLTDIQAFFGGVSPTSLSEYYARNNESVTDDVGFVNQYYYTKPSSYQYYANSTAVIKSSSSSTPVGGTLYWDGYTYSWSTDYTTSASTFGITTASGGASVYRGNLVGQVGVDWWWAIYVSTFEYRIGNLGIPEHNSGDPISFSDFYGNGYLSGYWDYT